MPSLTRTRRRFEHSHDLRFLTFSCYQRRKLLSNPMIADFLAAQLSNARDRLGFRLSAWVAMPEHVHLLIWPKLPGHPVPAVLRAIKQPVAQRVIDRWRAMQAPIVQSVTDFGGTARFWQRGGGYDRNICSEGEFREYMHMNPVKRGLVKRPEEWAWSSARWYAGIREGEIRIDPVRRPE